MWGCQARMGYFFELDDDELDDDELDDGFDVLDEEDGV